MELVQVGWRLDKDIVEEIQRVAKEEERSVTAVVRRLLRAALKTPSSPNGSFPPSIYNNNIPPISLTSSSPYNTNTLSRLAPKPRAKRAENDPDFDVFWAEYPRKTAKEAARRAWETARARVGAETILNGLRAAVWPAETQFIPHPSTWLNQGRWDDQPPPVRPRDEDMIPL